MQNKKELLLCFVANIFEWYDYAIFGYLALLIGDKFFPPTSAESSLLKAMLVFALGFLVRPLGGVLFGVMGDKFGRKVAFSNAVLCMACPTALLCVLPSYETIGVTASILALLARLMQGISMGGVFPSSISFMIEHAEQKKRGFISSFSMASCSVGSLLGALVCYITESSFSPAIFNAWAFRIPFIIGAFIFMAGIYIKKYTQETPFYKEVQARKGLVRFPLLETITMHWRNLIIAILIKGIGVSLFFLQVVFLPTYLKTNSTLMPETWINTCFIYMAIAALYFGWLCDRYSRRTLNIINSCAIIIIMPLVLKGLEFQNFYLVLLSLLLLSTFNAAHMGTGPALTSELFPTQVRSTALSIAYSVGSIFGGLAPMSATYLLQKTETIMSSLIYIIPCALLSLVALYFYRSPISN
ncbi:MAG: Proline/betaine transporter [Bacillota bacterium]